MPRVPMPEGPQFQPGGNAPQGRLAAPEASDIGQRQVMALGGAMQEFGASVGGIARDMQAQADELRITDALNQYKERALTLQHDKDAGYLRVRGKDTFDRPDGKSLTEFYGGQLANAAGDIAGTLGNDRQRAAFTQRQVVFRAAALIRVALDDDVLFGKLFEAGRGASQHGPGIIRQTALVERKIDPDLLATQEAASGDVRATQRLLHRRRGGRGGAIDRAVFRVPFLGNKAAPAAAGFSRRAV